ncbi:hypothetical protein P3T39_007095 [Kitasatospora sp. GP82]|nr:dihydrofolate reductase [Kitasatospora sp. GP82]MDH6130102.1 hypothetical protein [Kitasatospora sp. GP82]
MASTLTRIIADISVSLDGFVTGPDPGPDNGLGIGGEALHTWAFSDDPDDRRVLRESTARSGAVVLGRRLFDVVDGPKGRNDDTGYGAGEVGKPAFVVVTSSPPESVRLTDLDWTFVTTGLPDAVAAARERAEAAASQRSAARTSTSSSSPGAPNVTDTCQPSRVSSNSHGRTA